MKVKDVMHTGAYVVETETPLQEVARRMKLDDIGVVPVKADGKLVGILTDRDIIVRAVAAKADLEQTTAGQIMSRQPLCCQDDDDLEEAIETMQSKRVRRMPVLDARRRPVGILSLGDISHEVPAKEAGALLRSVSAHHAK